MSSINLNFEQYDADIHEACMKRLLMAGEAIRDEARRILAGKLKGGWKEHGPYKTGKHAGQTWTARQHREMVKTVRAVRSKDLSKKNILVIGGNYNTWWATQLEYGRGGWRGGARPFIRPAVAGTESRVKAILEGGQGEGNI